MNVNSLALFLLADVGLVLGGGLRHQHGQTKVDVCHRNDDGDYHLISIPEHVLQSHLDYGDVLIDGDVPRMPGYIFDANCEPYLNEIFRFLYYGICGDLNGNSYSELWWKLGVDSLDTCKTLCTDISCDTGENCAVGFWYGLDYGILKCACIFDSYEDLLGVDDPDNEWTKQYCPGTGPIGDTPYCCPWIVCYERI